MPARKKPVLASPPTPSPASSSRAPSVEEASLAPTQHQQQQQSLEYKLYGDHPPVADADGYYWYRTGRVAKQNKLRNTVIFVLLHVVACSDTFTDFVRWYIAFWRGDLIDFGNLTHVAAVLSVIAVGTSLTYYALCRSVERAYYDDEASRAASQEWKVKPFMWLSSDLRRQEMLLGCFNAALGAVFGMCIVIFGQLSPRTASPGLVKIYYRLEGDEFYRSWLTELAGGWVWAAASAVIFFVGGDLWAYLAHRLLHFPLLYRHIHYIHHQFRAVSPFGAYAVHPLEFIFLSVGFQFVTLLLPIHAGVLTMQLFYVGILAIKDHSGVDFDGWFVWSCSASYHDEHHTSWHTNFGQSLIGWDRMLGTLKKKGTSYTEKTFAY
jgi:sterol desaturase/sphingolipid hydroxylase (fatty acid hydroxylase superfamily)